MKTQRVLNTVFNPTFFLPVTENVTLSEDMEVKQEIVMMSPPASDSGSGSPHQFSPYCVDSEPGSPLMDHDQVTDVGHTNVDIMSNVQLF